MQVKFDNVYKKFGEVEVLKNFDITIKNGEFLVLLGPSGCGKSTALRLLAGLEEPTSGEIYIGNNPVSHLEPKERDISMVFQSYALYPHMTAYENITYPLKIKKISKGERKKKADDIAVILGLENYLNRKPKELSGGQRQRVALGRALIRNHNVCLMDEPLSNIDAKLREHMRGKIKRLHEDLGITSLYVTHDQTEAMTMANRIAIMHKGNLVQLANPDKVYSKPVNRYVGEFIGSPPMNFIEGRYISGKNQVDFGNYNQSLDREWIEILDTKLSSDELFLGVRPENVFVSTEYEEGSMEAIVYVVEPLGKEIIVTLKSGDHLITAEVEADMELKMNQRVWLSMKKKSIHIFDGKTNENLT